ncbi:MAG TPA: universal stress protein [Propionicimonas sp.]|jgi:nucleotide-binding universal stress UspA family protein|uniref:universal stress protein n=1 Tax=Propionicimonas sp. TaxID=1955623 RepID=UPI002F41415D
MAVQGSLQGSGRSRILVGVDGSQDGLRAVKYATREAQASGAGLWIVHAVDEAMPVTGLWDLVSTREVLLRAGEAIIAEAVGVAGGLGLPSERVSAEVVFGRPSDVLADLSGGARMMVVGRRSLNGLERMFVGSTSVSAAVRAECPVIVISAASTPHRTGDRKTVAVAVSTWPVHESALGWGIREAVLRKARLRVVHVVPETLGVEGAGFVAAATAGIEEQLAPLREQHPAVPMEVDVRLGDPVDALVEASRTVDILILGIHRDRAPLGGALRGVIAHAHCPVGLIK